MNKNFVFSLINAFAFLAVAIVWVLSLIFVEAFAWFNLGYGIAFVCAIVGLTFAIGANKKLDTMTKKAKLALALCFWVIAVVALVFALALPTTFVPALVCLVIAIAIVLSVLLVGGEKWDKGDNEKPGYKNYYERKAEQEKNNDK